MVQADQDAEKKITAGKGKISEPTPELKKYMTEAGERSWTLFTDPNSKQHVPNAKEILESAKRYAK
ncbi:MAG: hypothetical protein HDQ94_04215 [Desulfovibrio sp.]|nr:hypothetical protein [Desulfovibrio sp.]